MSIDRSPPRSGGFVATLPTSVLPPPGVQPCPRRGRHLARLTPMWIACLPDSRGSRWSRVLPGAIRMAPSSRACDGMERR
jgi:hypothetical protein